MGIHYLKPDQSLESAIVEHDTILLAPGKHKGGIRIKKNIKLIGEIGAIIEGDGESPCICIAEDGIEVNLSSLIIENGRAEFGGGVLVDAYGEVTIESCRFNKNQAGQGGGAGIGVLFGLVRLHDCRFEKDQDAFISNVGEASFSNCALLGGLSAYENAKVNAFGGEIKGVVRMKGSSSRQPRLTLSQTEIEDIENHSTFPGEVRRL